MPDLWMTIDEFPNYKVSESGIVINKTTNREIRPSRTSQGAVKVGLYDADGVQTTRSLKVLVAEAFVGGQSEIFDTPIQLDTDPLNCHADNLRWRPRWFAWQYARQFRDSYFQRQTHYFRGPIEELTEGIIYDSIYHAATTKGLLMWHVYININSKWERPAVFPGSLVFESMVGAFNQTYNDT